MYVDNKITFILLCIQNDEQELMIIMTLILISYIAGERKQLQLCLATKAVERLSFQEGLDDDGSHHQHHHRHQPQGSHSSWIKDDFLCDRCVQQLPSVQRRPTPKVSQTEKVKEDHFEILQSHLFSIERYGHSVHEEGSLPLGTYASHIILTKGTTLVNG